ncbi:MAG TPA: tetratricopeptide repeat protein [Kofleriaceae bacterium]|jgi:hypothetical protein
MSCPNIEQLAAAASGEELGDDALFAHLDTCAACQRALDEQVATRSFLGEAPAVPALSDRLRETFAAEVMARADLVPARQLRWRPLAGLLLAAAAAVAITLGVRTREETAVEVVASIPAPVEDVALEVAPIPARVIVDTRRPIGRPTDAPPARVVEPAVQRAQLDGDADYARTTDGDRETVTLSKGTLTIDALHAQPVRVVAGDTSVAVNKARARVTAIGGVVAQVDVFAGSVEVTYGDKTQLVDEGDVWTRPSAADDSLVAFRAGWNALRAGDNAKAVALFDSARDEVVAEDAMYWAAVASERNGDPHGALARYRQLLQRFPQSTRAKEARAAIERLK